MSISFIIYARYLAGYEYSEIEEELDLHKGRAEFEVVRIKLLLREVNFYGEA